MRFDALGIVAVVVGIALVAGFVFVMNDRDARARQAPALAQESLSQRQQAVEESDLYQLKEERDAAQRAFRAAERSGERGAITAALDRFNAASRRYAEAKLRRAENGGL